MLMSRADKSIGIYSFVMKITPAAGRRRARWQIPLPLQVIQESRAVERIDCHRPEPKDVTQRALNCSSRCARCLMPPNFRVPMSLPSTSGTPRPVHRSPGHPCRLPKPQPFPSNDEAASYHTSISNRRSQCPIRTPLQGWSNRPYWVHRKMVDLSIHSIAVGHEEVTGEAEKRYSDGSSFAGCPPGRHGNRVGAGSGAW
jgi:hypothetical protein